MTLRRDLAKMKKYIKKQLGFDVEEESGLDDFTKEEIEDIYEELMEWEKQTEKQAEPPSEPAEPQVGQKTEPQPTPQPKANMKRQSKKNARKQKVEDKGEKTQKHQDLQKPDISLLLKKARLALSDQEAEQYYNQILEIDIENIDAWYGKFLVRSKLYAEIQNEFPCKKFRVKNMKPWDLFEATAREYLQVRDRILAELRNVPDTVRQLFASKDVEKRSSLEEYHNVILKGAVRMGLVLLDESNRSRQPFIGWTWPAIEALLQSAIYFRNCLRIANDQFGSCTKCKGHGYETIPTAHFVSDNLADIYTCVRLCFNCKGMGLVRKAE